MSQLSLGDDGDLDGVVPRVGSIEERFAELGRNAESISTQLARVSRDVAAIAKANEKGDVTAIRRGLLKLVESTGDLGDPVAVLGASWGPSEDEFDGDFDSRVILEVIEACKCSGIAVTQRPDGKVWAAGRVLSVRSGAVRLGRERLAGLRPSQLTQEIETISRRRGDRKPDQFVKAVFGAYKVCSGGEMGRIVTLRAIHEALTLLPEVRDAYKLEDFLLEFNVLNTAGPTSTADHEMTIIGGGGAAKSNEALEFIDTEGNFRSFYGVKFSLRDLDREEVSDVDDPTE